MLCALRCYRLANSQPSPLWDTPAVVVEEHSLPGRWEYLGAGLVQLIRTLSWSDVLPVIHHESLDYINKALYLLTLIDYH